MNRFLVIRFELYKSFYNSLILCKAKSDGPEYRVTVMDGEIEKQLCSNNIIKEINGCLQVDLSSNKLQNKIKSQVAKALGKIIGKPVKEVETKGEGTGDRLKINNVPTG